MFDEKLNKLNQPLALTIEEIAQKLKNHQVSFIGDGVERLLSQSLGLQIKYVEIVEMMDVKSLFEAVFAKYFNKTLDFPKPLYIREAQTCVKLEKNYSYVINFMLHNFVNISFIFVKEVYCD